MPQFDLTTAPLQIATVRLRVRDLDRVAGFYRDALGLGVLAQDADSVALGTVAGPLLHLAGDPRASRRDPRDAGLFHTAFLLPSRADLGRWLAHAVASGLTLEGASDHLVSEAVYLSDPEGNGIEIYADRPVDGWRGPDGHIRMATEAFDAQGVLAAAGGSGWAGFPAGGMVGHVHLQVGDTAAAEEFYAGVLGLDVASRYPGASFFGSGGYHHQLAGNVWNSRRAGPRPREAAGLEEVAVLLRDAATRDAILARAATAGIAAETTAAGPVLHDPWGTAINLAVRTGA